MTFLHPSFQQHKAQLFASSSTPRANDAHSCGALDSKQSKVLA
jgi:hypothetical protein